MRRIITGAGAAVLCASLVLLGGCKAPNLQDRMDDAGEIFRLNVGLGPGFLANVHATRALALGIGSYDARRIGFRNGYGWIWDERRYDTNLVIPLWGWEDVDSVLYGSMPKTLLRGDEHDPLPPGKEEGWLRWADMPLTLRDKNRGWLEVSANVHIIWIGIDVGVDAGEFLDCLAGWAGLDPAGDDAHSRAEFEKHDVELVTPSQGPAPK